MTIKWIVGMGAIKSALLGLSLVFFPVVGSITSAQYIMDLFGFLGHVLIGVILIASSFLSYLSFTKKFIFTKISFMFLALQQFILLLSAVGGVQATFYGMYANGVYLPRIFIFNDQIIYLMFAIIHFIILHNYAKKDIRWAS